MKFAIVIPTYKEVRIIDVWDVQAAQRVAMLNGVDHGTVYMSREGGGLAAVVYEFGLCRRDLKTGKPLRPLPLFAYYRTLYAGNCVLYSFDSVGETIDLVPAADEIARDIIWLPTIEEAEKAITCDLVRRPVRAINDEVISAWPNL